MEDEKAVLDEADHDDESDAERIKKEAEKTELMELWMKMKRHNELESGATRESLHAKYLRFSMEKEFVELLSNPRYLQLLAQRGLFEDDRFLRYLDYLQYWRTASYAKCIKHVHCLRFLELLQNEQFRAKCKHHSFIEMMHQNQFYHWKQIKTLEFQQKYQINHGMQPQQQPPAAAINHTDMQTDLNQNEESNDTNNINAMQYFQEDEAANTNQT